MKWWNWLKRWLLGGQGQVLWPKEDSMNEAYDPNELLSMVKQVLGEMGWKFGEDPERPALLMASGGKHGLYFCTLLVHPEHRALAFYSYVQCRTPEEKRPAMVELLTRANYGLWVGNFELDVRDGEIRYKTSVDFTGGEFTGGMLMQALHTNLATIDRYLPAILSLLWNDVAPEDAIGLTEAA